MSSKKRAEAPVGAMVEGEPMVERVHLLSDAETNFYKSRLRAISRFAEIVASTVPPTLEQDMDRHKVIQSCRRIINCLHLELDVVASTVKQVAVALGMDPEVFVFRDASDCGYSIGKLVKELAVRTTKLHI
jgi:hypothetical protein